MFDLTTDNFRELNNRTKLIIAIPEYFKNKKERDFSILFPKKGIYFMYTENDNKPLRYLYNSKFPIKG